MSFALLFHAIILFVLLQTLVTIGVNLFIFRRPPRRPAPTAGDAPRISILVPARDEETRLPRCLDSLLMQDYPNLEILVLDDHSSDATARVARDRGFVAEPASTRRLMIGETLPPDWTGKAWACQQLARAARGEFLLFTDADTWHEPDCLSSVFAFATDGHADLVGLWPRQITKTWSERLVIPLIGLLILGFMPHVLLWLPQRFPALAQRVPRRMLWGLGGACGQFLFFRRAAYDAIGGHEAVRDHLIEDVALARRIAERIPDGLRLFNCDGSQLVSCRMYENLAGIWEGFTKNIRAAFDSRLGMFIAFGLMQLVCFFLPFVLICLPGLPELWWRVAALEVALIYLVRIIITLRLGTSWVSVVFHPFAQIFALLVGLNSWRLSRGKGVRWKGRTYTMGET
jgi:chlorobactene glucosyltransferase